MSNNLLTISEQFARDFTKKNIEKTYFFHSISHIENTVEAATTLAEQHQLSKEDSQDIAIAMWFHDLGFSEGWKDHEKRSVEIAREFLQNQQVEENRIEQIINCIYATTRDAKPQTLLEKIARDADTSHLGSKTYFEALARLRAEWEAHGDQNFSEEEWYKLNVDFLESHKFHTAIARSLFANRKRKNLLKLKKQQSEYRSFKKLTSEEGSVVPAGEFTEKKLGRGVETMFRVTLRNHNNLSRIADNKANIMLSINAIMLSIVISSLVPKLDSNPTLLIPTIILILVCMISIILATLATRPKITAENYTDEKFLNKRVNILFFGNFYKMPVEKFEWGIKKIMQDDDLLYGSLAKDLYYLGVILATKYRYLYICYNIFMIGLLLAGISFIVVLYFNELA